MGLMHPENLLGNFFPCLKQARYKDYPKVIRCMGKLANNNHLRSSKIHIRVEMAAYHVISHATREDPERFQHISIK